MPPAGQNALARSTLLRKPVARRLPRPHVALQSLRLPRRLDAGAAGSAPQTPPCLPAARAAPVRGRPRPRPAEAHGFSPFWPEEKHPRALVLGRVPWIFGYVHYLRIALLCIICFVWRGGVSPCLSSYRYAIIPS